jgi:serine/threonine protein kinase
MPDDGYSGLDHNAETNDVPPDKRGVSHSADQADEIQPNLPTHIGMYRIVRVIGQGGMGTVYEAEQDSPRRTVALKVIRAGVANARLLRRFEYEAQILGNLEHPGIATIFEAGTFDEGQGLQPYFAMEFIDGKLLTDYASDKGLSTRDRLVLLAQVADAIQHAHQKGIIHRDLKPANILVDQSGQVKILDFGVARATDADIHSVTLQTDIGQLVGTLPYMSPEQAAGNPEDLDTRSDVYALGVIAYELLTGHMPYKLEQRLIHEAVRMIREDRPAPLSSTDRSLRGDVEIMVGKALEKDKARRYQNASDFSADIEHYLNNQPIVARPPSKVYQLRKFVARNKAVVTGTIAVLIVSVAGTIVSTSYAIGESVQRQIAQDNEQLAHEAQAVAEQKTIDAQLEQEITQSINDFLNIRLLGSAAPDKEGRDVLVRDMLHIAAAELDANPPSHQKVEAALRLTIGRTYTGLGLYVESESHLRTAVDLWVQIEGPGSLHTADAMEALAFSLLRTHQYDEGLTLAKRVLKNRQDQLGKNHALTIRSQGDVVMFDALQRGEIAGGLNDMALDLVRMAQGKNESREDLRQRLNDMIIKLETLVSADRKDEAILMLHDEAKPFLESGLLRERVPYAFASYSILLSQQGMRRAAEAMAEYSLQASGEHLRPDHPYALHSLYAVSSVYWELGRRQESHEHLSLYLEGKARNLGEDHPETLNVVSMQGDQLMSMGNYALAEERYKHALNGRRRTLGNEHHDTLTSIFNLGKLYEHQGRYADAEPYFLEDLATCRSKYGNEHEETLLSIHNLAVVYLNMNHYTQSEELAMELLSVRGKTSGDSHPDTRSVIELLVSLYDTWDRAEPGNGHDAKAETWRLRLTSNINQD